MPTALIAGGHGKVAQHITRQLIGSGDGNTSTPRYAVHSIIRDPAQAPALRQLGATPIVQDLERATVAELQRTLGRVQPDVVVWAAGAGYGAPPERVDAVDHRAAVKIMDAMEGSGGGGGAARLVSISALDVRDRERRPVPEWYDAADRAASDAVWGAIGVFLGAKLRADRELRTGNARRGLRYTIVRPGGLSDGPGDGLVSAGKVHLGRMVKREDVARVVVECIANSDTVGLAFDVVGGEAAIAEAVKEVGENKIDTFEGYY